MQKLLSFAKGGPGFLEAMAVIYVAAVGLFLANPDWPILMANKAFAAFDWPMVFFPTEKFWYSLAVSVPGTRAFLAFAAARNWDAARIYVRVLKVSLVLTGLLFAWHFLFYRHAALYALGFCVEAIQLSFLFFLNRYLP